MRRSLRWLSWFSAFAVATTLHPAAFAPMPPQAGCSDLTLGARTFRVLNEGRGEWKNAFVYAGDIRPRWFGGFEPFTVQVVVGKWYPPLSGASGTLSEAAFEKVTATTNVERVQRLVTKGGETLSFRVTQRPSRLTVTRVLPAKRTVELRLCP